MADLMWFFLEAIVRVINPVGVAAGLMALAVTGLVALGLMVWRKRMILREDKRA